MVIQKKVLSFVVILIWSSCLYDMLYFNIIWRVKYNLYLHLTRFLKLILKWKNQFDLVEQYRNIKLVSNYLSWGRFFQEMLQLYLTYFKLDIYTSQLSPAAGCWMFQRFSVSLMEHQLRLVEKEIEKSHISGVATGW